MSAGTKLHDKAALLAVGSVENAPGFAEHPSGGGLAHTERNPLRAADNPEAHIAVCDRLNLNIINVRTAVRHRHDSLVQVGRLNLGWHGLVKAFNVLTSRTPFAPVAIRTVPGAGCIA